MTPVERDQPVGFRYFSPVTAPVIDGPSAAHTAALSADDETVLAFGMVETGPRSIRARRLVVDPQRPRDLTRLDLTGLHADAVAVVANARETRALAGGIADLRAAARRVRGASGAVAVVVKDSARGCMVLTGDGEGTLTRVGPYPTRTVWPLGSGDVFAAAYAHAWDKGAEPVEAARIASSSAAWWSGTRATVVPHQVLGGAPVDEVLPDAGPELAVPDNDPLVYLAAPFFNLAERWLVETCRSVLIGLGAQVFSPLHDVGPGGDEVASRDLDGLDRAHAVFALLDGWDPGTVYEVGWAHRKGLPVVGFLQGPSHEGTKMLVGTCAELHQDLSSALYRAVWAAQGHPLTPSRVTGHA
ncbi:nucleoside 2-deoxyribosyltransferase [Dactylosporangium roseum]|uniref:Nucleoside 2-deoxyribosyltransferase n=2 Tax=Dactylosporangium roseum TaxID=47989 RepID=A0ABY5Z4C3_9ACTN|nr:PfkB family carbohydrate kinase [Dactylosporangium roseum]UWZ36406.1 nucleoside 2-deoxyribosyltransferase [Dactylosporangium roseum]